MRISDWSSDVCSSDLYQIESQAPFTDLVVPVMIDEQPRWWQLSAQPIIDEDGIHRGFRGVGSDITEARLSEDKINRMARYDALTGLPNRALLMDGLEEALIRAHRLRRSDEHTSELHSLMRLSYAGFCLKNKTTHTP